MMNFFKRSKDNLDGKVVAFLNQKGGVGKTTMAFNFAHALKNVGHKVLAIDLDPQYNFSSLFNVIPREDQNIYQLLINSVRELKALHSPVLLSDILTETESGIDLIPAGQILSGLELSVANMNGPRQLILKKFFEKYDLKNTYDYIIIDGPPTLGLIVVNILSASDGVLFPFIPDAFSTQGLRNIHEVISDIKDMGIVTPAKVLGYIPNLYEKRRKQSDHDFKLIMDEFSDGPIFDPIYNRASISKTVSKRKSLFDYNSTEFQEIQNQFIDMAKSIDNNLRLQ